MIDKYIKTVSIFRSYLNDKNLDSKGRERLNSEILELENKIKELRPPDQVQSVLTPEPVNAIKPPPPVPISKAVNYIARELKDAKSAFICANCNDINKYCSQCFRIK